MNTIELRFAVAGVNREMLLAQLSQVGCDAFEETESELLAYVTESVYDVEAIKTIAENAGYAFSSRSIPAQNWNAVWESSFEPVVVPGFCTVRANFHPPSVSTPFEVIVTPKMSFGTGHHATTRLMIGAMRDIDFKDSEVLDFGTGTGILAILASQLGAQNVLAIDNDEWSVVNASENMAANKVASMEVIQGSLESISAGISFNAILANINRHILLQYMGSLRSMLRMDGTLLLSGILTDDEPVIIESAKSAGLVYTATFTERDWIALKFTG